jgi:hypothetical protein
MSVRVSSVFVLSCVGIGLTSGLITRPRSPISCLKFIILMENRPEGLIRNVQEDEEKEEEGIFLYYFYFIHTLC